MRFRNDRQAYGYAKEVGGEVFYANVRSRSYVSVRRIGDLYEVDRYDSSEKKHEVIGGLERDRAQALVRELCMAMIAGM